jgi:hypothetical protein
VGGAQRHDPERHPEGIRRARHVHLSAEAVAAPRDGRLRVLRGARPAMEHDLDQRVSHPRGGIDRRPGGRVHPGERDRVRPARRGAGFPSTALRRASPSSSTPTTTFSRRSRSSARRGSCGPG